MAMTRGGRAVGWKSRGLAKDSEGVGGMRARGQQCQEGDRSLIGATFSVHQRQQQAGCCHRPGFAATPSSCFLLCVGVWGLPSVFLDADPLACVLKSAASLCLHLCLSPGFFATGSAINLLLP